VLHDLTEEESIVESFIKYYGDYYDSARDEGITFARPDTPISGGTQLDMERRNALYTSRLISIEGFRRLFEEVGKRSFIQREIDQHKDDIDSLHMQSQF
jgi:hypothetical protein